MEENKKIVVFCCENSAYRAADAVQDGTVFESVEMIRLPCSGKIEIDLVLKCLEQDHPGVLVLGCPVDNCKFIKGNIRARKRVDVVKQALRNAGYDENNVKVDFLSSVDSHKFVNIVNEMKQQIVN